MARKYSKMLFKETAPLTYMVFLQRGQRKWLRETDPDAIVERIEYPNAKFMPSYRLGTWSGMVDQVKFSSIAYVMMFKLAWAGNT